MKTTPFNLIYSGIDLRELFDEVKELSNLYDFYNQTFSITDPHYINIPAIVIDKDDTTFTLKNAFGTEITHIDGYYKDYSFIEASLDMPLNKNDYADIYGMDIVIVRIKTSLKWIKLFSDDFKYNVFNIAFLERYKYFLNYLVNAKVSPVNGTIKSIKVNSSNSDLRDVVINDGSNDYTITCDSKYLNVKVNDKVNKYDLLEEKIKVSFNDGAIEIQDLTNENKELIDLAKPLFGVVKTT